MASYFAWIYRDCPVPPLISGYYHANLKISGPHTHGGRATVKKLE